MLVSNIKWISSRYAYNAILSYLSEVLKDASITTLDFNCDEVGDEGAEAIANALMNLHYKSITLNLWSNCISGKGAKAVAALLKNYNCKLDSLNLGVNQIGTEEAMAIADALTNENCKLSALDFSSNHIGGEGAAAIYAALRNDNCCLIKLDLSNNAISAELLASVDHIVEEKRAISSRNQLAEKPANMEEEWKRLAEILQNNGSIVDLVRDSLAKYYASISEFKTTLEEERAAIDKQENLQKKIAMIKELGECIKKAEDDTKLVSGEVNKQLDKKAAEVREVRRVFDAKAEEVNKRIDEEEEEKKKPLSAWKGECALSQRIAERLLAEYKGNLYCEHLEMIYEELVSNSKGDPVLRTVMLIYYYRSFAHSYPYDVDEIGLANGLVDDKGATIIACGLKLSTKVIKLRLCKQTPARLY
ncbi:MAG: hypothetical protein P4L69_06105 [Desulfosporosinus sp.]|nr:hypothetical protein [Desulfosporosinus sp.]